MGRRKGRSEIIIERSPFKVRQYERKMVLGVVLTLTVFLMTFYLLGLDQPENATLNLSLLLFLVWLSPLIYYAIGSTSDLGMPLYRWDPDRWRTLTLRRPFLFQVCLMISLLVLEASWSDLTVHMWLFALYLPVIIHYFWVIESRLTITDRGVATKVGVLTWDDIGEIRVYPKDSVIAFQVLGPRRLLYPYALYSVKEPKVVTRALMAVQMAGLDTKG